MKALPLAAILVLGAFLRFRGLHWGLPSVGWPHPPFHPDETWSMSVMKELNPATFQFNPRDAHREGTLAYYLWLLVAAGLRAVGAVATFPADFKDYGPDYTTFLYWGRVMTGCLDLGTIALVYLILRRTCRNNVGPVLGALTLAIAPFEVIHAHYLRSHIVANFFATLSILLALPLLKSDDRRALGWSAFAAGLAAATRYPSGIVVSVPLMFWLARVGLSKPWRAPRAFLRACLQAAGCSLGGFILADPFLFFRYHSAQGALANQGSYVATQEFHGLSWFDLSRVGNYLRYLIPYGGLPWLWVGFYAAALFLFFRRQGRALNRPLVIFLALYLYPMAKGYLASSAFIRGALLLFPVFSILVGGAFDALWSKWGRSGNWALGGVAAILLMPSLFYDLAYTQAMDESDPRTELHEFLTTSAVYSQPRLLGSTSSPTPEKFTVAYPPSAYDYFLLLPALAGIPADRIHAGADLPADYLILTAFAAGDDARVRAEMTSLEARRKYQLERIFSHPLRFAGISFDFPENPQDLQYPLPKFYLLRAEALR